MAARTASTVVLALVLAAAVVAPASAAMSCSAVYSTLMPCLQYVREGGTPARGCCNGIKDLLSQANNTPDRRTICGCLKNVANGAADSTLIDRASPLPSKCNVNLPYKISPTVNCATIR
uniref:Non-specific lipid-transfer protein n=1 Tax=Dactylis glomerata TaxID=4509 RepID=D3Y4E1_DACGL|nr:non-specific lipid transfer protein 1 [Dactylis glomerata]